MLSFLPAMCEALVDGTVGMAIFDMPSEVSFAMGFALGPVAIIIVTVSVLRLNDLGYGKEKGIAAALVASCPFDNVMSLVCFVICETIVWQRASARLGLETDSSRQQLTIGFLFVQIVGGIFAGILLGLFAWFFRFIKNERAAKYSKIVFCTVMAVLFVVASKTPFKINGHTLSFTNAKFVGCLAFGYTCGRVWGPQGRPKEEMAYVSKIMQPALHGSVGSSLVLAQIRASDVGNAFGVLVCGQFTRFCVVLLGTYTPSKKYTLKERLFIASTFLPKSTTVATVASNIYNEAMTKDDEFAEYKSWGLQI